MCGCNQGGKWKVTFPDGKYAIKRSEASAKLAAQSKPGSRYEKMS